MTCPCCRTEHESSEGMTWWTALGMIVFGLIIADRLVGDDVDDYLDRRRNRKAQDARNACQD